MTQAQLIKQWKQRPYSWSQHSSFVWSKEQWFGSYILNIRGDASASMAFGNVVGESIATDKPLSGVPRQVHMEYEIQVKMGVGSFDLIGFFDSYDPERKLMEEYKTSSNAKKWNKTSVDEHGQLTFYCMLLYLRDKIKPEDVKIRLHYIPVSEQSDFSMKVSGAHQTFETKRTMKQVMDLMVEIKRRRVEMEKFAVEMIEDGYTNEMLAI